MGCSQRTAQKNEGSIPAPMLDMGLSGLMTDLDQRGLLDETMVVCVGEFGRSPEKEQYIR